MKSLFLPLFIFGTVLTLSAKEVTTLEAQTDPASVDVLAIGENSFDAAWLMNNASKLTSLQEVVISGVTDNVVAMNLVASVAACNTVRSIRFRNCSLQTLPANLRMLTKVTSFTSENTTVSDGEQFYNAIADMSGVLNVSVIGSEFRSLPKSFSRLRVMDDVSLFNTDVQLISGYNRNNKTLEDLRSTETVQFGFGEDALNLNYTCYNSEAGKSHIQMIRDVLQGAFRSTNTFYNPVSSQGFTKTHPLVKPPVNGVDIYPDVYSVNSLTGSVLDYGSGTRIIVPACAFEDQNGNPVTGNVDITYREFRDQVDIVLSGIPMKYDSGGVAGDFQSAGMFEMEASQNGTEVFLRDGKEVSLKFAVTDTASNYNFYRLDEQNGWTYLENTGNVESGESGISDPPTTRTPELAMYDGSDNNRMQDGTAGQPATTAVRLYSNAVSNIFVRNWIRDTTDFDTRYNDTNYYGMDRLTTGNGSVESSIKSKLSSRIYFEKRADGDDYTVLSIHNSVGKWGFNNEMAAYGAYNWKFNEKMSRKEVENRFGTDAGINDCRVIQDGSEYYLQLKYYWGFDKIKVEPVRLNAENQPVAVEEEQQEKLFGSYTRKLNSRRNRVNRDNAGQIWRQDRCVVRAHNDSLNAWGGLKKAMTNEEKDMDFTSWKEYVQHANLSNSKYLLAGLFMKTTVKFQMITIPRMGVHNCDRIVKMTNPVVFVAKKIVVAGSVIVPAIIHVLNDKFRGSVFSFSNGILGGVHATYEAEGGNHLLITDAKGNLYEVAQDEFNRGISGNKTEPVFEAILLPSDGATAATVRKAEDSGN